MMRGLLYARLSHLAASVNEVGPGDGSGLVPSDQSADEFGGNPQPKNFKKVHDLDQLPDATLRLQEKGVGTNEHDTTVVQARLEPTPDYEGKCPSCFGPTHYEIDGHPQACAGQCIKCGRSICEHDSKDDMCAECSKAHSATE